MFKKKYARFCVYNAELFSEEIQFLNNLIKVVAKADVASFKFTFTCLHVNNDTNTCFK